MRWFLQTLLQLTQLFFESLSSLSEAIRGSSSRRGWSWRPLPFILVILLEVALWSLRRTRWSSVVLSLLLLLLITVVRFLSLPERVSLRQRACDCRCRLPLACVSVCYTIFWVAVLLLRLLWVLLCATATTTTTTATSVVAELYLFVNILLLLQVTFFVFCHVSAIVKPAFARAHARSILPASVVMMMASCHRLSIVAYLLASTIFSGNVRTRPVIPYHKHVAFVDRKPKLFDFLHDLRCGYPHELEHDDHPLHLRLDLKRVTVVSDLIPV